MSILSTNSRLIKVGQDYSAGSGISIDDHVISVTGEFGKNYSAGDNISIYEQNEQLYISSKDWTNDIANASANAYNEAVAKIPDPFDPSFISAKVDNKLDTTAFTNWQNGQYSTDLQTIEGQINNKQDSLIFGHGTASGSVSSINGSAIIDDWTYHMLHVTRVSTANLHRTLNSNSGTWNTVTNKLDTTSFSTISSDFLTTSFEIPESATWNEVSTTVQINSATWGQGVTGGNEEVNSFVYNNSATINDVNTTYQANSGSYQPSGNYIPYTAVETSVFPSFETNSGLNIINYSNGILNSTYLSNNLIKISYNGTTVHIYSVLSNDKLKFITNSDSAYLDKEKIHTWDSASNYIQNISSTWNEVSTTVQSNSAQWSEGGGVTGEFVPQSAFDELKASYNALSSLFATYSGKWLLPNEGV